MNTRRLSLALAATAVALFSVEWLGQRETFAHPVAQGRMDVTIHERSVLIDAGIALEEICISNSLWVNNADKYAINEEHVSKHGAYLLKHLFVYADGKPLTGKLLNYELPERLRRELGPDEVLKETAQYKFEFALPDGAPPPATILLKQDVLNEVTYVPGNPWQAAYVITIAQVDRTRTEGLLLTSTQPLVFPCDWSPAPATVLAPGETAQAPVASVDRWATAKEFIHHGIWHILTGYDHLLFVTALVLAAVSFWDLVKVVSAFTLSHSLTLGLSVFNIVRLDSSIVEPMIAASIVFVALQNAFLPKQSRGWTRLAAAFFFGLFHGLGFAGGCLDAMAGMQTSTMVLAIVAFSLGVEIGHQMVVLPTFAVLTMLRRWQREPERVERFNGLTLKYGSLLISCAGIFYLFASLGLIHFSASKSNSRDAESTESHAAAN
jgi:hydrogenase/urease accessory protein HupE